MSDLGSMCVVRGGSSITTLPQYLASIGKNSFYARFVAGTNMFVNSDLTGGAVALNGTVGSWQAEAANTSNFTAYFAQAASGDRPLFAAANGVNSLYASGNATGDSRHMDLTSTSILNGAYSVLCRHPLVARDSRAPYSHNVSTVYWITSTGAGTMLTFAAGGQTSADQIIWVVRNTPATSAGNCVVGLSQTGTAHNGTAPRLLRRTTNYSASAISELWFTPQLTANELDAAMAFIS